MCPGQEVHHCQQLAAKWRMVRPLGFCVQQIVYGVSGHQEQKRNLQRYSENYLRMLLKYVNDCHSGVVIENPEIAR
jgi:hypothetical protein